jgi:hypothetical protein
VGTSTFFAIFADGEVQPWNDPNYKKKGKSDSDQEHNTQL